MNRKYNFGARGVFNSLCYAVDLLDSSYFVPENGCRGLYEISDPAVEIVRIPREGEGLVLTQNTLVRQKIPPNLKILGKFLKFTLSQVHNCQKHQTSLSVDCGNP